MHAHTCTRARAHTHAPQSRAGAPNAGPCGSRQDRAGALASAAPFFMSRICTRSKPGKDPPRSEACPQNPTWSVRQSHSRDSSQHPRAAASEGPQKPGGDAEAHIRALSSPPSPGLTPRCPSLFQNNLVQSYRAPPGGPGRSLRNTREGPFHCDPLTRRKAVWPTVSSASAKALRRCVTKRSGQLGAGQAWVPVVAPTAGPAALGKHFPSSVTWDDSAGSFGLL